MTIKGVLLDYRIAVIGAIIIIFGIAWFLTSQPTGTVVRFNTTLQTSTVSGTYNPNYTSNSTGYGYNQTNTTNQSFTTIVYSNSNTSGPIKLALPAGWVQLNQSMANSIRAQVPFLKSVFYPNETPYAYTIIVPSSFETALKTNRANNLLSSNNTDAEIVEAQVFGATSDYAINYENQFSKGSNVTKIFMGKYIAYVSSIGPTEYAIAVTDRSDIPGSGQSSVSGFVLVYTLAGVSSNNYGKQLYYNFGTAATVFNFTH